jgi:hypothetical protein
MLQEKLPYNAFLTQNMAFFAFTILYHTSRNRYYGTMQPKFNLLAATLN